MLGLYEVSCLRDFRKRFTTAWQVYTTRWNDPRHMLWGTMFMWNWYSFMDGNTVRADCAPFEKGCTVKGKSLVPVGANSFFKSRPLFWRGLVCRKVNRKSQKVIFFVNNCGKCTKVLVPLYGIFKSTLVISNSSGLWNTLSYPYFDISDLQNWGKTNSSNHI